MKKLLGKIAIVLAMIAAGAAAPHLLVASPERQHRRDLAAERDAVARAIESRESCLGRDDEMVTRARLASFRAAHRGDDAAAEGSRHRESAERLREENIHELNRLRARLYELEAELRGFGE